MKYCNSLSFQWFEETIKENIKIRANSKNLTQREVQTGIWPGSTALGPTQPAVIKNPACDPTQSQSPNSYTTQPGNPVCDPAQPEVIMEPRQWPHLTMDPSQQPHPPREPNQQIHPTMEPSQQATPTSKHGQWSHLTRHAESKCCLLVYTTSWPTQNPKLG